MIIITNNIIDSYVKVKIDFFASKIESQSGSGDKINIKNIHIIGKSQEKFLRSFLSFWRTPLSMSAICRRSGVPIEGKHSPPANPERVTSEALKRRDNGVLSGKIESVMKSKSYRDPSNKNYETPEIFGLWQGVEKKSLCR
ncbi:MAG: hypothetical protein AMK74_00200 [Nitrospira bacterium SM23_35]|nr:MAG: hypothetical protein AMK74_00200 [Nitrospira bacterium SM23_35]